MYEANRFNKVKSFLGTGFKFPIQVEEATGHVMTSSDEEDIKEAIYIILMTKKGERIMRPEFGCGIHNYAFSTMSYTNLKQMESEVMESLIMWEPRIIDLQVEVNEDTEGEGILYIKINYIVRSTNNPYNLVYPYYINEGG